MNWLAVKTPFRWERRSLAFAPLMGRTAAWVTPTGGRTSFVRSAPSNGSNHISTSHLKSPDSVPGVILTPVALGSTNLFRSLQVLQYLSLKLQQFAEWVL
jgi:hypothetical protein